MEVKVGTRALVGPKESWECNPKYCSVSTEFRIECAHRLEVLVKGLVEESVDEPKPEYVNEIKELLY